MEVSCREEKIFCPVKRKRQRIIRDVKKIPKSRSYATLPKSIAEIFGKEEKPTGKQKRQVTTCLFAKMSSFDDGAGNEIRKEQSDGIAERSEASRFRCNEVSRGREKAVIFLVKIKSREIFSAFYFYRTYDGFRTGAGNEIRTRDIRLGKATLYH